jgi:putative nucleotidyltransferase with HDIG domain
MKKKKKEEKITKLKVSTHSFYRFLIFFISFLLFVAVLTYERREVALGSHAKEGEPATKDIYAPFSFTFVDAVATEEARLLAADKVLSVFRPDVTVNEEILNELDIFLSDLDQSSDAISGTNVESVQRILAETNLKEILTAEELVQFKNLIRSTIVSILDEGLILFSQKIDFINQGKQFITLIKNNEETQVSVFDLISLGEARDKVYKIASDNFSRNRRVKNIFTDVVNIFLKENLTYDAEETRLRRQIVYEKVLPIEVTVMKNENILRRGRLLTQDQLVRMEELSKRITKKKAAVGIISTSIVLLLFMIIFALYFKNFERKIYFSLKHMIIINAALLVNVVLNKGLLTFLQADFYLLPTSFAPILVAILIKPRIGICVGIGMSIFSGIMTQYSPHIIIIALCSSLLAVYAVIDLRKRAHFFFVGFVVAIIHAVLIFAFAIMQDFSFIDALYSSRLGLLNGIFITVLLFPGLVIFENLFDITTNISLLELSDLNHPLLKRLIIEAPGTYHHSLVVSNLAESAAESIGANSLLARVGSYFHDIGKIEKAEYFTENQTSKERNFHDKLTPRMSYFIITNHVKDGIELSRKYKLKQLIVDFIQQHHGTSIVYYFYRKALDAQNQDEELSPSDYRYSGPKPQSKEIAITLLADSIEAASRTVAEPTPASLRGLVDKVVNDKFLDSQLDECELTLLDLHKIKESFVRNLMAIFHTRVEYPEMINESIQNKKFIS